MKSLIWAVRNLLPSPVQCEVLSAFIIPNGIIGKPFSPSTLTSDCTPFFSALEKAISRVFGTSRSRSYGPDDQGILGLVSHSENAILSYYLQQTHITKQEEVPKAFSHIFYPFSTPRSSCPIYSGTLSVRQEQLDFESCGELLSQLLLHAHIAYNPADPALPDILIYHDAIHEDGMVQTKAKGTPLLDQLCVVPKEVCVNNPRKGKAVWVVQPYRE